MKQRDVRPQVVLIQMRVNFGGSDAFMSEHFLHGAEVVTVADEELSLQGEGDVDADGLVADALREE